MIQGSGQARETPKHAPSYESLPTSMMDKPRERSEKDDRLDQEWNVMYREMETFKAEHGHCNVPQKQGSLGVWASKQRQARKKDKLFEVRVQKLDDLGFEWSLRGVLPTWDERYERLKAYKAEHGNCAVPQSNGPFGEWVNYQRSRRKKGKLSEERARKLDKLGFEWSLQDPPRTWDERFEELAKYKAEQGHCNVPRSQGSLGGWVTNQRTLFRKEKLSTERKQRLDNIGFEWGPSKGIPTTWDERLDELKEYKAEHGNCKTATYIKSCTVLLENGCIINGGRAGRTNCVRCASANLMILASTGATIVILGTRSQRGTNALGN